MSHTYFNVAFTDKGRYTNYARQVAWQKAELFAATQRKRGMRTHVYCSCVNEAVVVATRAPLNRS